MGEKERGQTRDGGKKQEGRAGSGPYDLLYSYSYSIVPVQNTGVLTVQLQHVSSAVTRTRTFCMYSMQDAKIISA